jgi:protein-S-isoprenylcysteine O-methyltransferase Ste14
VNFLQRVIASRSGEVNPATVILAILVIVIFVSATYGISVNIGQYIPQWALVLVIGLLGIGLVLFFRDKSD